MRDYARLRSLLLWDLEPWLKAGEDSFTSDMGLQSAFAKALADSFYKKLCPLGNTKEADEAALKKFRAINDSIPSVPFEFSASNEVESTFWDYFQNNFNRTIGFDAGDKNYDLEFIRDTMDTGPGAAQKADATTQTSKLFEGQMSWCNSADLIPLYRSALVETGLWADAERHRFERFGFTEVKGGKVFFAPKNAEISRTCCTEANLNLLIQMSLGAFLEYRLERHFGISLSTQPEYNRELARIGSIDGSFGTIDLVSASDSISWQLMQRVMENGFTKSVFRRARSESAVLPDGSEVVLNMISTMGNGFTFPLQTVIFASAVRACYQLMGFACRSPSKEFGVFGDDIIVRREVYEFLIRMLNKLGFEVNVSKSFNNGPFRESCGHDYFRGRNIRGVYVRSLETPQSMYSCFNRLTRWSADSGIPLARTLGFLWSSCRKTLVPYSESDDAGFKVPFTCTTPRLDNNYWFRYRFHKKVLRQQLMPEADQALNPHGLGVGYLSGSIRRRDTLLKPRLGPSFFMEGDYPKAMVALRDPPGSRPRYKVLYRSIPYWDWPGFSTKVKNHGKAYHEIDQQGDLRNEVSTTAWKAVVTAAVR